jgi:anaerobic magnesium-protoporphyrin IX monomethyl ester cyclase
MKTAAPEENRPAMQADEVPDDAPGVLLLSAPYADWTSPYHSLAYVAAPLRAAGYAVDVLDMNALWFRHVFRREQLLRWIARLGTELAELNARERLEVVEQERLVSVVRALGDAQDLQPEDALRTLRGEAFYDWDSYLEARAAVRRFEGIADVVHAPVSFAQAFAVPPHEPVAAELVAKSERCAGFVEELAELLHAHCGGRRYVFIGVSLPYSANLLPGMALLRAAGRVFPGVPRVAGGTAICDVYKYRRSPQTLEAFAPVCDLFYVGEAEPGIEQMTDHLAGRGGPLPSQAVPVLPGAAPPMRLPYVALDDLRQSRGNRRFVAYDWRARAPWYGWIDWSLYLAPERRVVYAPTRGCFWNQCTFCDYGLNEDGPTAPSRDMDPDVVIEHLAELAAQGIRHFYFAADAVAPAFLSKLADAILARGLDLSWSCQLFLTKNFTPALVHKLERSGLRSASFGLESGSSPVLERMGKGRDRAETVLAPALAAFRDSRIGLQPLFFFGFPGETDDDRQATVDLLLAHGDLFAPVPRAGVFTLLSGSMIARDPAGYGLTNLRHRDADDILWELDYDRVDNLPPATQQDFRRFNDQLPYSLSFERPWVGGIDTLHSHLYIERFGRGVFTRLREGVTARQPSWRHFAVESPFDLDEAIHNVVIHRAFCADGANACGLFPAAGELAGAVAEVLTPIARFERPQRFEIKLRDHREN